jgi:hypothetical protein
VYDVLCTVEDSCRAISLSFSFSENECARCEMELEMAWLMVGKKTAREARACCNSRQCKCSR